MKAAADELLATLDATQKAKATDILPGLAFGPGQMRGAVRGRPAAQALTRSIGAVSAAHARTLWAHQRPEGDRSNILF